MQYVIQTLGRDGRWYFTIGSKPNSDRAIIQRQVDAGNRAGHTYRVYEFSGDLGAEQIRVAAQYADERREIASRLIAGMKRRGKKSLT